MLVSQRSVSEPGLRHRDPRSSEPPATEQRRCSKLPYRGPLCYLWPTRDISAASGATLSGKIIGPILKLVIIMFCFPRFGFFVAVYGAQNTVGMIDGALARSALNDFGLNDYC